MIKKSSTFYNSLYYKRVKKVIPKSFVKLMKLPAASGGENDP